MRLTQLSPTELQEWLKENTNQVLNSPYFKHLGSTNAEITAATAALKSKTLTPETIPTIEKGWLSLEVESIWMNSNPGETPTIDTIYNITLQQFQSLNP